AAGWIRGADRCRAERTLAAVYTGGLPAGTGCARFCSAIATVAWRRCGNAVGPAIVVYGLPAASSTEQLGRLHHTRPPGAMPLTFRDTAPMDSRISDEA